MHPPYVSSVAGRPGSVEEEGELFFEEFVNLRASKFYHAGDDDDSDKEEDA